MPKKITVPLSERVCKRGHVGKYVERPRSNAACTECEWQKRKAIQDAVRALTPSRETPLDQRVCKRGHVGKYVARAGASPSCSECMKIAVAKYKVKADAVRALIKYKVEAEAIRALVHPKAPEASTKACGCACGCGA